MKNQFGKCTPVRRLQFEIWWIVSRVNNLRRIDHFWERLYSRSFGLLSIFGTGSKMNGLKSRLQRRKRKIQCFNDPKRRIRNRKKEKVNEAGEINKRDRVFVTKLL